MTDLIDNTLTTEPIENDEIKELKNELMALKFFVKELFYIIKKNRTSIDN